MKKNLPFIALFQLDFKKISEAKLLPKSKSLFELSAPKQGLIISVDLEDNLIIMVPAFNKDDAEGKELDKHGKPLAQFVRSLTPRVRGILNPQSTGGNLHKQVDELYGLGGKPRVGLGSWKDEKGGIEELTCVSTLQMFAIRWRRTFKEYFKLRTSAHVSHSETLLREVPYEICKFIVEAIYKELNLPHVPIEENPAISAMAKAHFAVQKEWQNHTQHCLKLLFINLIYHGEEKLINEIVKDHQHEEKEFKDKTDLTEIIDQVKYHVSLLKAARDGDILEFRAALSNLEFEGIPLNYAYLVGDNENALTLAAKIGHVGIIMEIEDYLRKNSYSQYLILENKNKYGKSPLVIAVENGHLEAAHLLMSSSYTVLNIFNAFIAAIKKGDLEIIKLILLKFQNIRETLIFSKDANGKNPLMIAMIEGRLEVFKLIFESNPQLKILNEVDDEGNNLLTLSMKYKHEHITEYLFQAGANFKSAFLVNLQKRDFDTLKAIMHHYFTYSAEQAYQFLYLQLAESIMRDDKIIFNLLLTYIPQEYISKTHTILNIAGYYDQPQFISDYLEFIPDEKPKIPETAKEVNPLSSAWLNNNKASVELLLSKRIITVTDFTYALHYEDFDFLNLIIPHIPPILPYFSIVMFYDCLVSAKLLIEKLAHVDQRLEESGDSILILAIQNGATAIVRHLLEHHRADPRQPDSKGYSPLIIASSSDDIEVFELILKSADHPQSELRQILEYATTQKNLKTLEIITKHLEWLTLRESSLSQNPQAFVNTNSINTTTETTSNSSYTLI